MGGRAAMGKLTTRKRSKRVLSSSKRSLPRIPVAALAGLAALAVAAGGGFAAVSLLGSRAPDMAIGVALPSPVLILLAIAYGRTLRREQAKVDRGDAAMKSNYDSIVAVLCAALDLSDNVTQGHAKHVSELVSVVAWQMGLRKEQVRQVEKAAILHDIGKIGVAAEILAKPAPLDDAEWTQMKRHPELGYRMLQEIDFLRDVGEIVLSHHERYDGSGYPEGQKGDAIPLGARIFAVVDAYQAMTSHRPYRKPMPHRRAVEEIVRNSGSQFDPAVVRAFLDAERRGLLHNADGNGVHRPVEPEPEVPAPALPGE